MNAPSTPKPLAYAEGFAYFYGRKFQLTPDVLIPRPETEAMIDISKALLLNPSESFFRDSSPARMMTYIPDVTDGFAQRAVPSAHQRMTSSYETGSQKNDSDGFTKKILDLGTGSGCIAITLALELGENTQITATDISLKALKIAKKNAKKLLPDHSQMHMHFILSDLCKNLKNQQFDLITANLPYVDPDWPWLDTKALTHEPSIALYAKDHGLATIKKFLAQAPAHLNPGATILLEHDPTQLQTIITHAQKHSFKIKSHTPYVTALTLT